MSDDPEFDLESDALCIKLAELFDGKDIEVCVHAMIMLMSFILCDEAETKEDALASALMIGATLPTAVESWYENKDFITMLN
jgi:hypothetical protein